MKALLTLLFGFLSVTYYSQSIEVRTEFDINKTDAIIDFVNSKKELGIKYSQAKIVEIEMVINRAGKIRLILLS